MCEKQWSSTLSLVNPGYLFLALMHAFRLSSTAIKHLKLVFLYTPFHFYINLFATTQNASEICVQIHLQVDQVVKNA